MNGDRRAALHYARACVRAGGLSLKLIAIVVLGLFGPTSIAWFHTHRRG